MEVNHKSRKDDGNHRKKLDENVDCRAGGILKGIAHGVAHNGGLVAIAALSAEVARLDIFLGIIPCAAGIAHEYCNEESGNRCAGEKSGDSVGSENESHKNGNHNGDNRRKNHFVK